VSRVSLRSTFETAVKIFRLESWLRLLFLCVLVGIAAGLVGVAFTVGLRFANEELLNGVLFEIKPGGVLNLVLLLAIPATGLFLAGLIAHKWAPEVRGGGVDPVIKAFHREQGLIRPRVPWFKAICSILTLGSGGSAGKEGPTVHIGAGIGSYLGQRLGLSVRDRRILMLSGCAAGLGAVLQTPLGGALFAAEMLYREPDFEHDAVIPGIISSVTAYSIFSAILGHQPLFGVGTLTLPTGQGAAGDYPPNFPSFYGSHLGELFHYALLSILLAIVAFFFVKALRFMRKVVRRSKISVLVWPLLAGLGLGLMAAVLMTVESMTPKHILGEGHEIAHKVLGSAITFDFDDFTIKALVLMLVCKILATCLTIGSGASGGVLFPTLFIGAMTGALYGKLWQGHDWMPNWLVPTPEARAGLIFVGMAGLFTGCTKTPIASLVMISEMTGSYGLVVPLMLVCASTYLLTASFTMDEDQVRGMADSPAHRGDFLVNVLEEISVRAAVSTHAPPELIHADMPFPQVLEKIKNSKATTYPIVDENDYLLGIFSLSDIRQIMNDRAVGNLVVAGDLGTPNVPTVTLDTPLSEALTLFTQLEIDELPVVEVANSSSRGGITVSTRIKRPRGPVGSRKVVGMLSRHDMIAAYRKRLNEIETLEAQESHGSQVFSDVKESESALADAALADEGETEAEEQKRVRREPVRDAGNITDDLLKDPLDQSAPPESPDKK